MPVLRSSLWNVGYTAVSILVLKALDAIFQAKVEKAWDESASPYLLKHGWPWVAPMVDFLGNFWGGAACALVIFFVLEVISARKIRSKKDVDPPKDLKEIDYISTRLRIRLDPTGSGYHLIETSSNIANWQQTILSVTEIHTDTSRLGCRIDCLSIFFENQTIYSRPIIDTFGSDLKGYTFYPQDTRGYVLTAEGLDKVGLFEIWFPPTDHYQLRADAIDVSGSSRLDAGRSLAVSQVKIPEIKDVATNAPALLANTSVFKKKYPPDEAAEMRAVARALSDFEATYIPPICQNLPGSSRDLLFNWEVKIGVGATVSILETLNKTRADVILARDKLNEIVRSKPYFRPDWQEFIDDWGRQRAFFPRRMI